MSTIKDFKNAPAGATASHADGRRVMKTEDGKKRWISPCESYYSDQEVEYLDYTLDSPAPTTAHGALALTWELAHPVKEGQVIPEGSRCIENQQGYGLKVYIAQLDYEISPEFVPVFRTLEPLPDPEPDWLAAHAVLARHRTHAPDSRPSLWANLGDGMWGHAETTKRADVWDLLDVTPLYPKEGQDA